MSFDPKFKICTRCKVNKPLWEFGYRANKPSPTTTCKECNRIYKKESELDILKKNQGLRVSPGFKYLY